MRSQHDVVTSGRARRAKRRRGPLSRAQVKEQARLEQWWEHLATGEAWRIRQLHRADGRRGESSREPKLAPVVLTRPGVGDRYLTFGELAAGYAPIENGDGGEV